MSKEADQNISPDELERRLKEKKWEEVQIKVRKCGSIHVSPLNSINGFLYSRFFLSCDLFIRV